MANTYAHLDDRERTYRYVATAEQQDNEDASVLLATAGALLSLGDRDAALQRYQRARIERTNSIVLKSAENAKRFHNSALALAEGADHYVSREWQPEKVRERYDWLFTYDALGVPI